jgi:hypothetical protein
LRTNDQELIDRRIIWYWPIPIFALIFTWYALVIVGFACLYLVTDAVTSVTNALIASGSALSTLGFDTVSNPPGKILAICEAGIGLFIVVYTITFLPGYLTAMQQRNEQVAWVYARTGAPPTAGRLLEWFYLDQPQMLDDLWSEWEAWFRAVGETHSAFPLICVTRSFRPEQNWLAGTAAMLDVTALASTTLDIGSASSANVCFETGVRALHSMAVVFVPEAQLHVNDLANIQVDRATFDTLCTRLAAAGAPVKKDREQAWHQFAMKRRQYEAEFAVIAKRILAPTHMHPVI